MGFSFDVYCDTDTSGSGWTLYAVTSASPVCRSCPYGSNELTSITGSAYVSTLMQDFSHSEFMQDMRSGWFQHHL